uniref:Dof-type domain-containing protein n=1 Tax=Bursaphelenchus xylophilus TaxID=6326 RepID=A0A1I7S130_BURXY
MRYLLIFTFSPLPSPHTPSINLSDPPPPMQNYTNGAASAAPPENLKNYAFMMNAYGYNPWMTPWLQSTVHGPYESAAVMDAAENNVISNSSLSSNSSGDPPTSSQNSPPLKSSIDLTNLTFAGNSSASLYNNYLNPEINSLFNQTINPVPLLASALPAATAAAPGRMLGRSTRAAASSRPSTARACECPNCLEFQRRGKDLELLLCSFHKKYVY